MRLLDELLTAFVAQGRMKLPGSRYRPCYRLVASCLTAHRRAIDRKALLRPMRPVCQDQTRTDYICPMRI